jgi:hypothetical protein
VPAHWQSKNDNTRRKKGLKYRIKSLALRRLEVMIAIGKWEKEDVKNFSNPIE